ncbi:hypothetical protein ACFQ33_19285, partial [Mycoplana ramosa]
ADGGSGGGALSGAWADGIGGDGYGGWAYGGAGGAGAAGGTATNGDGGAGGDGGYWGSNNGDDGFVTGTSHASADAAIHLSAFNQEIVLGANLQQNAVDMTVVGGDLTNTVVGEDDDA